MWNEAAEIPVPKSVASLQIEILSVERLKSDSETIVPSATAQKLCKPHQTTEKRVVSPRKAALFHKFINKYVENFIGQKYFPGNSA